MKSKVSIRTILAVLTLTAIGLLLFLFVSGSIGLTDSYNPLGSIMFLFSVIPLMIVATFLSFTIGNLNNQKFRPANSRAAKALSILTITSAFIGLLSTKISTLNITYNQTRGQFVLENIGTAAIFAAFVFAIILIDRQRYVFWPLWGRADKRQADERQLFVRQRVFEKSYRYVIFVILGSVLLIGFNASRMQKIAPLLVLLVAFSMPAVVAAWQKDS